MEQCVMLGIDASTKSTGVALFINGDLYNTWLLKSEIKDSIERIDNMINQIYTIIIQTNPSIIVMETPVAAKQNVQTQLLLAQILGAVRGMCINKNIFFYTYRPSAWRKQFDGVKPRKRIELKQWAIDKVKEIFDDDVQDDEAEAILIATAYIKEFS